MTPRKRVLSVNEQGLDSYERVPLVIQLLERLEHEGPTGLVRDFEHRLRGQPPKRLTNREIARFLLAELDFCEYMAAAYTDEADGLVEDAKRAARFGHPDGDLKGRIDPEARKLLRKRRARRLSPKSKLNTLTTSLHWRERTPTTDDLIPGVRADAERYRWKAERLKDELGPPFLNGTWEKREALVRLWRHRKAPLLSRSEGTRAPTR